MGLKIPRWQRRVGSSSTPRQSHIDRQFRLRRRRMRLLVAGGCLLRRVTSISYITHKSYHATRAPTLPPTPNRPSPP
jgi:hypothetical protein